MSVNQMSDVLRVLCKRTFPKDGINKGAGGEGKGGEREREREEA